MKRALMAAAVFSTVGAAQAGGTINPYFTVDGGIQSLSKDRFGERQTVFQDSPSASNRFGVRGAIDIREGWQATAQLEGRYFLNGNSAGPAYGSNGNVTPRLFDRGANIGLNGPFGEFRLGFINNPLVAAHVAGDIRPAANSGSGIFGWFRNRQIASSCVEGTCDFTYLQHALAWKSPSLGGFSGTAHYVFGRGNRDAETTGDHNHGGWGLSLGYKGGPFGANAGVQEMKDQAGVRIGRVALLNGNWTVGDFTFKAGATEFRQFEGGQLTPLNTAVTPGPSRLIPSVEQTNRLYSLGVGYQWSPQWRFTLAGYSYRRQGDAAQKVELATVSADYAFNRWVTAYAIVSAARNGSAANQSAGFYALTTTPGASNHALTIGLRASFDAMFNF